MFKDIILEKGKGGEQHRRDDCPRRNETQTHLKHVIYEVSIHRNTPAEIKA